MERSIELLLSLPLRGLLNIEYNNPALLCEHGGKIQLGKKWADSLLSRMNFALLDLTVNQVFKQELKECFIRWYAGLVKDQLRDGVQLENIKPDLRISVLKPLHANWLIEAISHISTDVIIEGFVKSRN